VRHLPETISL